MNKLVIPKGMKFTDDIKLKEAILQGLEKCNGHCPCNLIKDESTICPCVECRETGTCYCGLFIAKG